MPRSGEESKASHIIFIIGIVIQFIGLLGAFIISIIWFTRIHPWFSHGEKDGKKVYQCLIASFVFTIIGTVISLFLFISYVIIKSIWIWLENRRGFLFFIYALYFLVMLGSVVTTSITCEYGLKNPKINDDSNKNKCLKYVTYGINGARKWASKNGKGADFTKWLADLNKHALNDDLQYNGYLCYNVGVPTLTFDIVICVGMVLWLFYLI